MPYPQSMPTLTPCNVPVRRCPVPRNDASRRFLIVKFWALGDVLMATPLAAALRQAYPDCHITWLTHPHSVQVVDANPDVDEVIAWDGDFWKGLLCQRWKKMLHPRRFLGIPWLTQALRARRDLRRLRIDTLISMHPDMWPTVVYGTAPTQSIGIFETGVRPGRAPRYGRLYPTAFKAPQFQPHRTDNYLLPLRALGVDTAPSKRTSLGFTAEDARAVDDLLRAHPTPPDGPLVVLAPTTSWPSKNWPGERYAALGDVLTQRGCRVVFIGAAGEEASLEQIAGLMTHRPLVAAGTLPLRQMAALIARAAVLVGGDSAPMHAAAAVGTPYVALFGPTSAVNYAPLAGGGRALSHPVPCGPCHRTVCPNTGDDYLRCLRLISVGEVVGAVEGLRARATVTA